MSIEFQAAVLRELDQIQQRFERAGEAFERAVEKLEQRDEERDHEVSDLKLQVGMLRSECRRNIRRDAALVSAPTVLVSAVVAIVQHLMPAPPVPPAPVPTQPQAQHVTP